MGRDKGQDSDATPVGGGEGLRLFVEARLHAGARITPDDGQAHYLLHVMRARIGARVLLFNGIDGEWQARIAEVTRRSCALLCEAQSQAQAEVPDLWLAFAPIKKTPADYVAQKATELGSRVLQPVITRRTIARRVNLDRLRANAIEAAEQSGRLTVPEVREPVSLDALLKSWPAERRLLFCDEGGDAAPVAEALQKARGIAPGASSPGPKGDSIPPSGRPFAAAFSCFP